MIIHGLCLRLRRNSHHSSKHQANWNKNQQHQTETKMKTWTNKRIIIIWEKKWKRERERERTQKALSNYFRLTFAKIYINMYVDASGCFFLSSSERPDYAKRVESLKFLGADVLNFYHLSIVNWCQIATSHYNINYHRFQLTFTLKWVRPSPVRRKVVEFENKINGWRQCSNLFSSHAADKKKVGNKFYRTEKLYQYQICFQILKHLSNLNCTNKDLTFMPDDDRANNNLMELNFEGKQQKAIHIHCMSVSIVHWQNTDYTFYDWGGERGKKTYSTRFERMLESIRTEHGNLLWCQINKRPLLFKTLMIFSA